MILWDGINRWKGPQPGEELKQLRLVKMKSKVGIMERVDKQESDSGKLWEVSWNICRTHKSESNGLKK